MNFDKIKNDVLYSLIPEYSKTLCGVNKLADCEEPTTTFIKKLASLLLPDQQV